MSEFQKVLEYAPAEKAQMTLNSFHYFFLI